MIFRIFVNGISLGTITHIYCLYLSDTWMFSNTLLTLWHLVPIFHNVLPHQFWLADWDVTLGTRYLLDASSDKSLFCTLQRLRGIRVYSSFFWLWATSQISGQQICGDWRGVWTPRRPVFALLLIWGDDYSMTMKWWVVPPPTHKHTYHKRTPVFWPN